MSKTEPFIGKKEWKDINYPSGKDNWKKFVENHLPIYFNVL